MKYTLDKSKNLIKIHTSWYTGNNITNQIIHFPHSKPMLKALPEDKDLSLEGMLDGLISHVIEGKATLPDEKILRKNKSLKPVYDMDYDSSAAYQFEEL